MCSREGLLEYCDWLFCGYWTNLLTEEGCLTKPLMWKAYSLMIGVRQKLFCSLRQEFEQFTKMGSFSFCIDY